MSVRVITPPATLVDLATAKTHLEVTHDDHDVLIGIYIAAACAHLDGPDGWLGRAIGVQTLELRADDFRGIGGCGLIALPCPPFINVVSVIYDDADGEPITLDPSVYRVTGPAIRPVLGPVFNETWPPPRAQAEAVRIRYRAGYVADPEAAELVSAIPAAIIPAILLMVGDLYAHRETAAAGGSPKVEMIPSVERLLAPFRVWSV